MLRAIPCLLFLVSCRGLLPSTTSKSRISSNENSFFNLRLVTPAETETTLLSTLKDTDVATEKSTTDENNGSLNDDVKSPPKSSFWKSKVPKSWWKERILLEDLKIGQELSGHVVQEYLGAKTGPKLYFECGIGRTDQNGVWSIVNGMLRLDRGKASVARKRAARFRKKDKVQLFVSRVEPQCGRLELCAKIEHVEKYSSEPKISVTSLKAKQVVVGKVVKLYPYGAIIDVGANVRGLLHITKVARLMNRFIDKEKGLKNSGLEKGAKVRLMVESVEKRRLSLDFTEDVKDDARKELLAKEESKIKQQQLNDEPDHSQNVDELEAWAEYANQEAQEEKQDEEKVDDEVNDGDDNENEYEDEDEDEYDDKYDEDFDIESNLGLDMY